MIELNGTFLIQLVNFLVMMLFLNFFLFKPVMAIVEKRNKAMKSLSDETAKFAADAEKLLSAYDAKNAEVKKTTALILLAARQQGVAEQEQTLKAARDRYAETFDAAMAQMESQIQGAKAGLKGEADKISRQMASRLLGRNV